MKSMYAALAVAALVGLAAALGGCGSAPSGPTGTVTGHLVMAGGPAPGVTLHVPGTITASSAGGTRQASAAEDGSFTLVLPAGRYTLSGTSPRYNDGRAECLATAPVVVRQGAVTRADVACSMR
jgi:hypothetical protein